MLDRLLRLLKALPALAVAAVVILNLITGIGHEKWEEEVQKIAGFFGVLLAIFLALWYGDESKSIKMQLIRRSFYSTICFAALTGIAWIVETIFATTDILIFWFRDVLYPLMYFLLCASIIGFVGSAGLLIPKLSGHGTPQQDKQNA
jgi:hypothetical protein